MTSTANAATRASSLRLIHVHRVWDQGLHHAFTDLMRFGNRWLCAFREGTGHVPGSDGVIRVLESDDARTWRPAALLAEAGVDLRDPKLSVAPDGRAMLCIGSSVYAPGPIDSERSFESNRTRVAFSADGRTWTQPEPVSIDDEWLWRVTWHDGVGYGVSRPVRKTQVAAGVVRTDGLRPTGATLWRTTDGVNYQRIVRLDVDPALAPSEATVRFLPDGSMAILVRCNKGGARFGVAPPPYQRWTWIDLGIRVGGPNMLVLPSGDVVYAVREYRGNDAVCVVGVIDAGRPVPLTTLPSAGDCGYPGMDWDGRTLRVSYYSPHEHDGASQGLHRARTAIYLAELQA